MKKLVWVLAACAALPLTSARAADPVGPAYEAISGYVEAFGEYATDRISDGDYSPWVGGGAAARANIWFGQAWSLQLDGSVGNVGESYTDTYSVGSFDGTVHLSYRDPSHFLVGGFAQAGTFGDYNDTTSTFGAIGAEGQLYLDRMTVYGQAAYIKGLSGSQIDAYAMDLGLARLALRYFPGDNTKLEAGIGYVSGPIWGAGYDDTGSLVWNAEVEHRFGHAPVSIFARAAGIDGGGYHSFQTVNRVMVGARLQFGSDTLLAQDRNGATLQGVDGSTISWLRWE